MYAIITLKVAVKLPKGASKLEAFDGKGRGISINGKEYLPLLAMENNDKVIHSDGDFAKVGMDVVDYIDTDVQLMSNKQFEG